MSDIVQVVRPEDCEQIKKLLMQSFELSEKFVRPSCNRTWFKKRQEEGFTLVYEKDSQIVGYIGGTIKKGKLYIFDFCVDPNYRGQGIGTRLLLKQRELALAKGITCFWGTTMSKFEDAVRLYRNLGYTVKPMFGGIIYFEWKLQIDNKGL